MKKQQNKSIRLQKITIARINPKGMQKIYGGECQVTVDDTDSHFTHCTCPNIF